MSIISIFIASITFIFFINVTCTPTNNGKKCQVWGKTLKEGETLNHPQGMCMQAVCRTHTGVASIKKCSSLELLPPNCGVSEVDNSKTYPNCCPVTNCS